MFESLKKKFMSFLGKGKKASPKKKSSLKIRAKKPSAHKKKSKKRLAATAQEVIETAGEKEDTLDVGDILSNEQVKDIEEKEKKALLSQSREKPLNSQKGRKESKVEEKKFEKVPEVVVEKHHLTKEENFFTRLIRKMSASKLTQEQFNEIFIELELILLENNVALEAVDKIKENLSKTLVGQQVNKSYAESAILQALKDSILSILIEPPNLMEVIRKNAAPYVIIFFGINGTGKTTSIAKLSFLLKKSGLTSVLAAADTFRAASIEQLKIHADSLKVPLISHKYGSDPAAVAFDAIAYAKKHKINAVLIDTAGRMYTKDNLMKEMEKIIKVSRPDLKIFVGESITGNDVIEQARTFNEAIGIDGIILTKADIDEKAGSILSVSQVTGKPIYFLGTGQKYPDLEPFSKKTVLKNLGLS